jgi:hypothetical protein
MALRLLNAISSPSPEILSWLGVMIILTVTMAAAVCALGQGSDTQVRPYFDYSTSTLQNVKAGAWKPKVHLSMARTGSDLTLQIELRNNTNDYVQIPPINPRTCWISCRQKVKARFKEVPIKGTAGDYVKYGKEDICKLGPGNTISCRIKIPSFYAADLAPITELRLWFVEVIRTGMNSSFTFKATSDWLAVPGHRRSQ